MPELPEVQAHAERLAAESSGPPLGRVEPLSFTVLKTGPPPGEATGGRSSTSAGAASTCCGLRAVTFVVHLMQGGRLLDDASNRETTRRSGVVVRRRGPALLLTEQGNEREAGVWGVLAGDGADGPPLDGSGPRLTAGRRGLARVRRAIEASARVPARPARHRRPGSRLANEVCHRAKLSPFAKTAKLNRRRARRPSSAHPRSRRRPLAHERGRAT